MMPDLLQYQADLKLKKEADSVYAWCPVRKMQVKLSPEEWVRQLFVQYLIQDRNFSPAILSVEKSLRLYGMLRRFDILAYDRKGLPFLMVECKASSINLNQSVVDQIAAYNLTLKVPYITITNGPQTYSCHVDQETQKCTWLQEVPVCP